MSVVGIKLHMASCLKVSPDEVVEKILSLINDGFLTHVIGPALFQVCNINVFMEIIKLFVVEVRASSSVLNCLFEHNITDYYCTAASEDSITISHYW